MFSIKNPFRRVRNWPYLFVVAAYVTICTLVNATPFMDFTNDVYAFSLLLAFLVSLVEMKLTSIIGKAAAEKRWALAGIGLAVGLTLVSFLTSRQEDTSFGVIIFVLFLIGVVFSYFFSPNAIEALTERLASLRAKETLLVGDQEEKKKQLHQKGVNEISKNARGLRERIASDELAIEQIQKQKNADIEHLEQLEKLVISEIKGGHSDYQQSA